MCGGSLEIAARKTVIECEYCGTQQTLPKLDDDRRANMYDRANHFRRNNDFDKAMVDLLKKEHILTRSPNCRVIHQGDKVLIFDKANVSFVFNFHPTQSFEGYFVPVAKEGRYKVILEGESIGSLIGRRGETLDAIQHLANYAVNRSVDGHVRINVDAESYREKREDSLRRYARKKAQQVLKARRRTTLEPMNAYERHVIHSALQDMENITTHSTGTEPNRRVVIEYLR